MSSDANLGEKRVLNAQTAEQKLKQLEEVLDNYEKTNKLNIKLDNDLERYFDITEAKLLSMTGEDCGIAACLLANYSIHIQKQLNRHISKSEWAKECIDKAITPHISQYRVPSQYQSADEVKMLAIQGNEYTRKLNEIRVLAQTRVNTLLYISGKIDGLVKTYLELQQTKRKNRE